MLTKVIHFAERSLNKDNQSAIINPKNIKSDTGEFEKIVNRSTQHIVGIVGREVLHTDATYKIVWQGFPILLVGTTDKHRSFHPYGVAVCTSEQQKDFEFIFKSLKQGVENTFDTEFDPKYLISDAAKAIHNAAIEVFGNCILIIMCWFHMRKNVSEKLPTFIRDEAEQKFFLFDLDTLQPPKTEAIFDTALQLFIDKWRPVSNDLIKYFEEQWTEQNRNWFEGFAKQVPSTNNALESFNRLIKEEHTLRVRMDLGRFSVTLFVMVKTWTLFYVESYKTFNETPELTLKLWTEGYNWAKENQKITSRRRGNLIVYRSSKTDTFDDSNAWTDFDCFRSEAFSFNDTSFNYPISRENWLSAQCDCGDFFKLFMCRHIIGIGLRMKVITAPAEAKNIPIGQKRKRGRPAKAKRALVKQ